MATQHNTVSLAAGGAVQQAQFAHAGALLAGMGMECDDEHWTLHAVCRQWDIPSIDPQHMLLANLPGSTLLMR
jgi:hypothetical protein